MVKTLRVLAAATLTAALSAVSYGALAAEPIKIGLVTELTGPNAESGTYTVNGAKLALDQINKHGGVLGRQLELKVEDSQSTNPGAVLALSRLGSEGDITALIGPVRSTQIQAMAPTIIRLGLPMMIGGTDYGLTHSKDPWVFRARPNDDYSAKVIANFGVNTLKAKKWAVVYATDAFGTGGKNALLASLKALGVTPVLVQGYTSNSQDFTPIVLAVKQSGADIIGSYMPNSPDVGILSKQLRQLGVTIPWIGSPSLVTDTAMKLGKEALYGTYAIADFAPGANPQAQAYQKEYVQAYHREPDFYSSWAYDAVNLLAHSLTAANSTKPDAIRKAILAIHGMPGVEGTYDFDANGDGLHGYNVVRNENGKVVFVKHIAFTAPK